MSERKFGTKKTKKNYKGVKRSGIQNFQSSRAHLFFSPKQVHPKHLAKFFITYFLFSLCLGNSCCFQSKAAFSKALPINLLKRHLLIFFFFFSVKKVFMGLECRLAKFSFLIFFFFYFSLKIWLKSAIYFNISLGEGQGWGIRVFEISYRIFPFFFRRSSSLDRHVRSRTPIVVRLNTNAIFERHQL